MVRVMDRAAPLASPAAPLPPAVELLHIQKTFGSVNANNDVSLTIEKGSIHGIVGENGAGKSTLMSILYGFYTADSGEIRIDGKKRAIRNSADAIAAGIGMVHQHFMLVEPFTVLENIMLGAEGGWRLSQGRATARAEIERLSKNYGLTVDPDARTGDLPVGERQRIEILKALFRGCDILILDEPTGVLTPQETDQLFEILRLLNQQGVTVILVTHKLKEILSLTHCVSVMRQGELVATFPTAQTNQEQLVELMIGKKTDLRLRKSDTRPGEAILSVRSIALRDSLGVLRLDDIALDLRAGEIVGIAGVSGNGQSELLEILAGIRKPTIGKMRVGGQEFDASHWVDSEKLRGLGLAHVPEDRHKLGLVMGLPAWESAILGYQDDPRYRRGILMRPNIIKAACRKMMEAFDVRPRDPSLGSAKFSGGNQQKLILAREIEREPKILLAGQPTRGVDVGATAFIHRQLLALRDRGAAILLVSAELDEIMALSDRILVMFQGRIVSEVLARDAEEHALGLMMANASLEKGPSHLVDKGK